jgi:putative mRNA 3-end processing factor
MIRESDGIHIDGSKKVVADSRNARGDVNFVSHAHFDHMHQDSETEVVCSELTAKLMEARTGNSVRFTDSHSDMELIPSGHILGSTAAVVKGERKVLYTGDFSPRKRCYINGFEPVDADVMILETTYGIPAYTFPEQRELEQRIVDWIQDNDQPLFLFGYSLGKAQKIQHLVREATDRPLVAHGAVQNMNTAVEGLTEMEFNSVPYGENKDLLKEDGIFIGPTNFSRNDALNKLVEKVNGVKAGFSGWAATGSYQYRGGYDVTFPMSDHADFDELVETVKQVDPEKVYTTHGFDEAFASYLSRELGYNARALKKNQSSLTDFS